MSRGGSADRSIEARSAAARKGWVARRRQANARAAQPPAVRGAEVDRVLQGSQIGELIARIRAAHRGDGAA